jgi:hypothetical protein
MLAKASYAALNWETQHTEYNMNAHGIFIDVKKVIQKARH